MTEPINFQQASAKRASSLQASPEELNAMASMVAAIELAVAAGQPAPSGDCVISGLITTCLVCQAENIIELPMVEASPEDIVTLIALARRCSECEERARNAIAAKEIEEYLQGLDPME